MDREVRPKFGFVVYSTLTIDGEIQSPTPQ